VSCEAAKQFCITRAFGWGLRKNHYIHADQIPHALTETFTSDTPYSISGHRKGDAFLRYGETDPGLLSFGTLPQNGEVAVA
jgi:hypothetical protein